MQGRLPSHPSAQAMSGMTSAMSGGVAAGRGCGTQAEVTALDGGICAAQEEDKPQRGFLRWTRRSGRRSNEPVKTTVAMEPVIQTEKDARRSGSAKRSSIAQERRAPGPSQGVRDAAPTHEESPVQSPDVELSTFVTAAEHAREGKELQSFSAAHHDSEV